ncbi:hypothetical protein [Thermodesulfitimonas sp.]
MKGRFWWVLLSLVVAGGLFVFYLLSASPTGSLSFWKRERVSPHTVVITEREFICGERELLSEREAPRELVGLRLAQLRERFPVSAGWRIEANLPAALRLVQKVDRFCPVHRRYRHLGLKDGWMAVFEGPLGFNQRVLRCEKDLPETALTPGLREKLHRAMRFRKQPMAVQLELRQELEFRSEAALNAALENLDELQE